MAELAPPRPPKGADQFTTACDYCVVGCAYRVWRWPVKAGGAPDDTVPWANPAQHNLISWRGEAHHVLVLPDPEAHAVNPGGNHSMRGGTLAQKCHNPTNRTRERLGTPLLRVAGQLVPVSWDAAIEIMARVSQHVLKHHGEHAWGIKAYSYQYFENTYAITKLAFDAVGTPAFAPHDKCANTNDAAGLDDAGLEAFAPSYEDWGACEVLFCSGTDPFETKSTLFTQWIMHGARPDKTLIFATPHRTMGVAWGERAGGLWLPVLPGTDTLLHNAIARIIVERGWQDQAFIDRWIAQRWEVDQGLGRGTRNTPWQWRTTWGTFQSDWADYRAFVLGRDEHRLADAARLTGVPAEKMLRAAQLLAAPRADGSRPKASFMLEKGNYWSNNYLNSASFAALGLICGAGNRAGQVIGRGGGHQRGMVSAPGHPGWLSPEKYSGRRKKPLNLDRWLIDGKLRFAWVFGTTWIGAMAASKELERAIARHTVDQREQVGDTDPAAAAAALIARIEAGGLMLVDSDIYPVAPLNTRYADLVLPAATWGEADFTRCNGERRLRLYQAFADAPGEAKPDWWAVQAFARRMGWGERFAWTSASAVFEEAARHSRGGAYDYHELVQEARRQGTTGHALLARMGSDGIQTPVRRAHGRLFGTPRLHDPDNALADANAWRNKLIQAFNTHSGKAVLLKSPWNFPGWSEFYEAAKPRPEKNELWITNGRVNENWQSGFDDLRKPYTAARGLPQMLFMNPEDAAARGIASGDRVRVVNDTVYVLTGMPVGVESTDQHFKALLAAGHIKVTQGDFEAVAILDPGMRQGVAKAGFNHPAGPANAVCHAVPDPLTNNYRYKLGRGRVERLGVSEFVEDLQGVSLKARGLI
ncbi:MAG: molybdopterin-dependent oxidoreductase [Betaproteobacteria bacterium]|nr:molybdopterin-dependent oxidoreductase [Betaproteobacteria bacterium]